MPFSGKIGFNGKTVDVKVSVRLEHQWGNIKNLNQENCGWRWLRLRFNDGRMMAFRHCVTPPDTMQVYQRNHFFMVHPDGRIEYGCPNREMRFTPTGSWTVPGIDYQWKPEGLIETSFGDFFLKALVDDSVFISKGGMACGEQHFQTRGELARMRTLPEQDLARELPITGLTPRP